MENDMVLLLVLYINARRNHARAFQEYRYAVKCKTAQLIRSQLLADEMEPDQVPHELIPLVLDPDLWIEQPGRELIDHYAEDSHEAMDQMIAEILPGAYLKAFWGKKLNIMEQLIFEKMIPDMETHETWEKTMQYMHCVLIWILTKCCRYCGRKNAKTPCSGGCKKVYYCSKECIVANNADPYYGHNKKECNVLVDKKCGL